MQEEVDEEMAGVGRRGFEGRRFADANTVRRILQMRDAGGASDAEIETRFGLRKGVVAKLGKKGVVRTVD